MMAGGRKDMDGWLHKISDRLDSAAAEALDVEAELAAVKRRDDLLEHTTICVVDVAGFGGASRTRANYAALRQGMNTAVERAFREAGMPWADCHQDLGHVFEGEGYGTPTDLRYCINSISLRLVPDEG
jgi:hypothetical protein